MTQVAGYFSTRLRSRLLCGYFGKDAGTPRVSAQVSKDYSLVYVIEGGGVYRDTDHVIRFGPGWVVQRIPERDHEIVYDTASALHHASMHLPSEAFTLLVRCGVATVRVPAFEIGRHPHLLRRYDDIIDELSWQSDGRLFVTVAKMQALVTDLHALATENQIVRSPRIQRACNVIGEHVSEGISAAEVADMVHMSESHFRRSFTHEVGMSPHQYLIRERIRSAQRLLCTTAMTIGEIANSLGYGNQFAFSKQFRQTCDASPSEYRKQYQL